jgi:signal transduction histidine kinase
MRNHVPAPPLEADCRIEGNEMQDSSLSTEAAQNHRGANDWTPELLQDCLELAGIGLWKWNFETNLLDYNKQCQDILAIPDEAKPDLECLLSRIHAADRDRLQDALNLAKAHPDRSVFGFEIRIPRADDSMGWAVIRGKGIEPREKSLVGTLVDVSTQKEHEATRQEQTRELQRELRDCQASEHATKEHEQLFRQAVILSRVLVYVIDMETQNVERLSGLEAILGPGNSGTISSYDDYHRRIHPDDVSKPLANLKRILETDCLNYESEYRILNYLNEYVYVWDRGVVLRDAAGKARKLMGATVDIDARKRIEEKYKASVLQLEEADRRKDEFMAVLSHELRNPLTPLTAGVAVLKNALKSPEKSQVLTSTLALMERQVSHMSRLIDDLLDLSRITRGHIHLREEHVDLREIVRNLASDYRQMIEDKGVSFHMNLPEESTWVKGDPTRLAQAIGNLFHNASKFTPAGGLIRLDLQSEGDFVVVRIKDTGLGIEKNLLPKVFDSFTQGAQSLDRAFGGLGLGLSITRSIVNLHQGEVYVFSEGHGTGAEFGIRLPLLPEQTQVMENKPENQTPLQRRKILVVEDDPFNADMMSLLLRDTLGHEVQVAHDALSALKIAEHFQPEVVICDIGLPAEMNGYDFARAFRAIPANANRLLIALTGYASELDKDKARQAGFDHHMAKPPKLSELKVLLAT